MSIANIFKKLNSRDTRILPSINTLTKIIFIALIAIAVIFFVKNIFAQTTLLKEKQDSILKGNNQESWLTGAMGNNLFSVMTMVTGPLEFNTDGSIKTVGYTPGGLIGGTNKMISGLYKQPVSGVEYIAQVKDNFLGKPTYAQGVAFKNNNSLQPLIPAWRTFRNVVYALSSLIFITIGIMIMLRVKISPQAVITIQNSIPKLVTSLILVTFSYAIAGLIIDLSNFFLSLTLTLFFSTKNIALNNNLFGNPVLDGGGTPVLSWLGNAIQAGYRAIAGSWGDKPYDLSALTNSNFGKIYDLTNRAIPASSGVMLGQVAGQIFLGTLLGGIGNIALGGLGTDIAGTIGAVGGDVVGGVLGFLLLPIIMAMLMVFWLIKLYFGLLKCYITIIFKIIVAPIEIGLGAIPNMKMGFSSWVIDIIANVSVFPITVLFLVFLNYLTDMLVTGSIWIPSQIDMTTIGGTSAVVGAGIGLAGIAMVSKLPKLVPEAIFQLKPSPFGTAIGEGFAGPSKWAKGTATSSAKAGIDYSDERFGEGGSVWKKGLRATNRILGGKFSRKRIEDASTTQSDKKV